MRDQAPAAPAPGRAGLTARVSALYAAVYLHYGVFGVFMPVWLAHQGVGAEKVGLLVSIPMLLRVVFVAPVLGLADRLRRIRELLFACLAATSALMAALNLAHGFVAIAALFVVMSVSWDPIPILADAYAVCAVRARGLDFGRLRVWGSIAFVAANLIGGKAIDLAGVRIVPALTAALLLVPLAVIPLLPADRTLGEAAPSAKGEWRGLLSNGPLVLVMLATALIVSSQALFAVFAAIHWTAKGYSATFVGFLSAIGISAEIMVLWLAQMGLKGRSPLWLILVCGALTLLRWLLLALDPGPALLVVAQLLQGPGMGVIAGLMLFMAEVAPPRLVATAQGVNAVVVGLFAAVVAAASGFLWRVLGAHAYLVMALVAAIGCLAIASQLRGVGRKAA